MTEALLFPLFIRKFRCLLRVCKHAENAAKHRKTPNFRKIGGSTQFFLCVWKRSANSENFGRLKTLAPETEEKRYPRDKISILRVARSSRRAPNQISIRICTARYREIWICRSGGFRGCCIFSGKHHIWDPKPMSLTLWMIDTHKWCSTTEYGNIEWPSTDISHIRMSHVAHINESCRTCEQVMSQSLDDWIRQHPVAYYCNMPQMNESCRTY